MRKALLRFLYVGVGGGMAASLLFFVLLFGLGIGYDERGGTLTDGAGAFALVLSGFAGPVVLSLDWWFSVAVLGYTLYLTHRRVGGPSA